MTASLQHYLVITALGADRPGIVNTITRHVSSCGCNIEDSRLAMLGDEFTFIMLLSGSWNAINLIESTLPLKGAELELLIVMKRTTARPPQAMPNTVWVQVEVPDSPHIIERFTALCDTWNMNIAELVSRTQPGDGDSAQLFIHLKTTAGDGYIYALIEHQSTPDRHMAFRLMRYAIAAMQRHLDAGHDRLPLVIPVLFYHGLVSPYPFSLRWLDEFVAPELAGHLYHGAFPLADITVIPDDEIATHQRMATLELLQKHIRQRDLAQLLDKLSELLLTGLATESQVQALMHYLVQAGNTREPIKFIRELALRTPQHKETLMTIAEYLEQQGLERGLAQGRQEGRQEGRKEEAQRIAVAMLHSGLPRDLVARLTGLTEQELTPLAD